MIIILLIQAPIIPTCKFKFFLLSDKYNNRNWTYKVNKA